VSLLADLAGAVGPDNLITAPAALRTYETDGLASHRAIPHAVVLPTSTAQVAAAVRACRALHAA
jgi:glycolate oxidase